MAKNKVIKEPLFTYQELEELYKEACAEICDYIRYEHEAESKLKYLKDFIRFKKLDEEFAYFCEHAIEDPDEELPFPYLILP